MSVLPLPNRSRSGYTIHIAIIASLVALFGARPFAGGWNDGSRLATVESIVDRHTLSIDESIFVQPPNGAGRTPYPPNDEILKRGTMDKLFVDGRYYSDKPVVPAFLMAVIYQLLQWTIGLRAALHPNLFVYLMTIFSAGFAYVIAVICVYRLSQRWDWTEKQRLFFTASFALASMALVYSRQTSAHIILMAVAAALTWALASWSSSQRPLARIAGIGALAGFGYTMDLGVGPILWGCTGLWVAWRSRSIRGVALFTLGSLPFLAVHHTLNYWLCGSWKPANSFPALLAWPGSPFGVHNMTGLFNHDGAWSFLYYAGYLLFGTKGFIGHNLPAILLMVAVVVLPKRRDKETPELVWAFAWTGGAWLLYAVASNNASGGCCSVRWFVPFLPAWYFVIGTLLDRRPQWWGDFCVLTGGSLAIAALGWSRGPWMLGNVWGYWLWVGVTAVVWVTHRLRRSGDEHHGIEYEKPTLSKAG